MKTIDIFPGSTEAIGQALDIFGETRIVTGAWKDPIRVNNVTADEVSFAARTVSQIETVHVIQAQALVVNFKSNDPATERTEEFSSSLELR